MHRSKASHAVGQKYQSLGDKFSSLSFMSPCCNVKRWSDTAQCTLAPGRLSASLLKTDPDVRICRTLVTVPETDAERSATLVHFTALHTALNIALTEMTYFFNTATLYEN